MSIIPDTYGESASTFRLSGSTVYGVVVLGHSFGAGVPSAVDACNAIWDAWDAADIQLVLADSWSLDSVEITINDGGVMLSGEDTRGIITGVVSANAVDPQVAVLVKKSTDQGGRAGRGRMYMPGWVETGTSESGVLAPSDLTLYQARMTDFLNALSTGSVPMRLLHSVAGPAPADVLALAVDSLVATQRRRVRR